MGSNIVLAVRAGPFNNCVIKNVQILNANFYIDSAHYEKINSQVSKRNFFQTVSKWLSKHWIQNVENQTNSMQNTAFLTVICTSPFNIRKRKTMLIRGFLVLDRSKTLYIVFSPPASLSPSLSHPLPLPLSPSLSLRLLNF